MRLTEHSKITTEHSKTTARQVWQSCSKLRLCSGATSASCVPLVSFRDKRALCVFIVS